MLWQPTHGILQPNQSWRRGQGTPGGATTTLNPSDKSASGVLSGGDLTFKNNNGSDARIGVRSVAGHTKAGGGKWYFEWHNDTSASLYHAFGISPTTEPFSIFMYSGPGGSGAAASDGMYLNGNATADAVDSSTTINEYNAIAIDFDNLKMWAYIGWSGRWNGGVIGAQNPAANTGGMNISALATDTYYATFQLYGNQDQITANFGGSAYQFTPPSGFSNW